MKKVNIYGLKITIHQKPMLYRPLSILLAPREE